MLRRTFLLLALLLALVALPGAAAAAPGKPQPAGTPIFIDTDTGVDDAVALAWALRRPDANLVGITTVAGNTSVENATHNVLTLLDAAGKSTPVTMGAAAPLVFSASQVGGFVHGPTGLWFSQVRHDLSGIPHDAPAAIAAAARANPGLTLVALGPLTNVAQAAQRYPAEMRGVRVIALAGAAHGGNRTVVAETNAYNDPQALDAVLHSSLDVTLIPLEAFEEVMLDSEKFPRRLSERGGAIGQLLAAALGPYFASVTNGAGGDGEIPDVAAVAYALQPELGEAQSALVKVVAEPALVRGQTVFTTDPNQKATMIADDAELSALVWRMFTEPGFNLMEAMGQILARQQDNAKVVLAFDGKRAAQMLTRDLTR